MGMAAVQKKNPPIIVVCHARLTIENPFEGIRCDTMRCDAMYLYRKYMVVLFDVSHLYLSSNEYYE